MSTKFKEAIEKRRSYYQISKIIPNSDEQIQELVEHAVKHTPSAFNSQSGRTVILLKEHHDKLWQITRESLRAIIPEEHFQATNDKIQSFQDGYGTILFFDDQSVVEGLQNQFPTYKDNFPVWAQQSNGMLQLVVWTALEAEGLGASLQHYGELIHDQVKVTWGIPSSWKLIAQMPFGAQTGQPAEKVFESLQDRIQIFK